ncbi:aryl sulfotransferase [Methanocella sp. CWC-04]|uniref:Aryl sulfotransferase n=1 Tax=Methanooceanicella nereidis TaxID=2052831 RepID=A0AAP2REU0_9EURY|nr:aryl-sulfate sulfotransferase [Methanocella sp. CWC-04]MCD1296018.1 aryl sulfotransferase [Methanocella sp. CWC-04]
MLRIFFIVVTVIAILNSIIIGPYGFSPSPYPAVTVYEKDMAFNGYTLYSSLAGDKSMGSEGVVYLVDMEGNIVHRWLTDHVPGDHGHLLPDGTLLFSGVVNTGPSPGGGKGGVIQEIGWNGTVLWEYSDDRMHHDHFRMPDGNTLAIVWESLPADFSGRIPGGIPGTEDAGSMWSDAIIEIDRNGSVVWEWHCHEHLDPEKYTIHSLDKRNEWTHVNSVKYIPAGNMFNGRESILISIRELDTVAIIDKGTGDIVWEWGHGILNHQHDARMLDNGNILIYNNYENDDSLVKTGGLLPHSSVIEVDPRTGDIVWRYDIESEDGTIFFSCLISGASRLPNGNTLICEGCSGRIIEVTPDKKIVWEFTNPCYPVSLKGNSVYRAYRYGPEEIDWPEDFLSPGHNGTSLPGPSAADFAGSVIIRAGATGLNMLYHIKEILEGF